MTTSKGGKPTLYSEEVADKICEIVSTHTCSLQKMCDMYDYFPQKKQTINQWRLKHPSFSAKFREAKRIQAEIFAEEIIEIADDVSQDNLTSEDGNVRPNSEWINRSRVRIDSRKWIACKLAPKLYGDKQEVEVTFRQDEWVDKLEGIITTDLKG